MHRKRKRREFAQRRDKECEGMTEAERKEWMDKQKEESMAVLRVSMSRFTKEGEAGGGNEHRAAGCHRYSLSRSNEY